MSESKEQKVELRSSRTEHEHSLAAGLSWGQLIWALILASLLVGLTDFAFLPTSLLMGLGVSRSLGVLAPIFVANSIPYLAMVLAGFFLVEQTHRRTRLSTFQVCGTAAFAASPYTLYVAFYTFEGPRVRDLVYQPVLVACIFLSLSLGVFLLFRTFLRLRAEPGVSIVGILSAALVHGLLLQINRNVLPNEYLPLHVFVSATSIILSGFCSLEISKAPIFSRRAIKLQWVLVASLFAGTLGSAAMLQKSQTLSWAVWGESAAARYITLPWMLDEPEETESLVDGQQREKPLVAKGAREKAYLELRRNDLAPHIVVFSVDNLQADRVGAYGYQENPTTPNIDRIARKGVLFRRAYSLYPGTRVFMSSMLTGRRLPKFGAHKLPTRFKQNALTRMLKQRDYHILVKGVFELVRSRNFDPSDYEIDTSLRRATAKEIGASKTIPHIPIKERMKKLRKHLEEAKETQKPVFVWMHFLRPHRSRGKFVADKKYPFGRSLDGLYDSAVAKADSWLKPIEAALQETLSDDRGVIWVIMSDHGAGMTRNKKNTGKTLYDDQVRVPLIISGSGIVAAEVDVPVDAAVDTAATLLDLVGIDAPAEYDGVSLLPFLEGRAEESLFEGRLIPLRSRGMTGGVLRGFKYIANRKSYSFYNTDLDPIERNNLADEEPRRLKEMVKRVKREHRRQDKEFRRRL